MVDEFGGRYGDLLAGSYDCVDRIVLNAYFSLGHNPGGFRVWWRRLHGESDEQPDNTHLMRMAGRFSRRLRASAAAHGIPVIDCKRGERKHQLAMEYLATHTVGAGVFLILVARASAAVWEVTRSSTEVIVNLTKKMAFVNHYSFHIMGPQWGHVTIKMSGHPPFGAQMEKMFDRVVDWTRSQLDVPTLRTLFGAKQRPARNSTPDLSLQLAAMIDTSVRPDHVQSPFRAFDIEGLHQRF
ncbi:MAG: hypothetical protein JO281_06560 [Pseudonocardiales bacterium]|nr:hypothetical protein [Pseudonocardiales bacterium]